MKIAIPGEKAWTTIFKKGGKKTAAAKTVVKKGSLVTGEKATYYRLNANK